MTLLPARWPPLSVAAAASASAAAPVLLGVAVAELLLVLVPHSPPPPVRRESPLLRDERLLGTPLVPAAGIGWRDS